MSKTIRIGKKSIGEGHPCFIIAEMSANHGGSFDRAIEILRAAKDMGADAIKLQTYRGDTITLDSDSDDFRIPGDSPWQAQKTLFSLYEQAHTPWEWHEALFAEARDCGLEIFSSPFDHSAVDLLESLNAPAYKIASPEITDIPLIARIGATGKPVFLSTGVGDRSDVSLAVATLRNAGCKDIVLLKCTTSYPAPLAEANLRTIPAMAKDFDCLAGLSDHTPGGLVPVLAVAAGACAVEKHYILNKDDTSLDAFFSLDTCEFRQMVEDIRAAEVALGAVSYDISASAQKSLRGRRSLYVSSPIQEGELFSPENIRSVRPGMGLHPKYWNEVLGRKATRPLRPGERLSWDAVEKTEK